MVDILRPRSKLTSNIFARPVSAVKPVTKSSEPPADRVRVCVRLRPCGTAEIPHWTHSSQSIHASNSAQPEFVLDSILGESADNSSVYAKTCSDLVRNAMDGFNACAFAYGQTASGKTHTLSGTAEDPGLIPLAIADVFHYVSQHQDKVYLLRASYLEVFNESIRDLLTSMPGTSAGLNLRSDGDHVSVSGLRQEVVVNEEQVRDLLRRGGKNRKTGGTEWNERSSRSHSVFQLIIESSSGTGGATTTSSISLIDLAGSEKASDNLERRGEGKNINRSLLTLGIVIGKLVENSRNHKTDHVPFRDSKLTRLLEPSLKGNAVVSVICTINPTARFSEESLSTLQFATRVKRIKLNATKKEDEDGTHAVLKQYQEEIKKLRRQLEEQRRGVVPDANSENELAVVKERMEQLTKLILNSHSGLSLDGPARPVSPTKLSASSIHVEDQLFALEKQNSSQAQKIRHLELELERRPKVAIGPNSDEMNKYIMKLEQENQMLNIVIKDLEETRAGSHSAPLNFQTKQDFKYRIETLEKKLQEETEHNIRLNHELKISEETKKQLTIMALGQCHDMLSPKGSKQIPLNNLIDSPLANQRKKRGPRRSTSLSEILPHFDHTSSLANYGSLLSEQPVPGMFDLSMRNRGTALPVVPISGSTQDIDFCDDVF